MVTKLERQIRSKAATVANRNSYQVRESDVDALEALRTATGLDMEDVDQRLGESNNWYSNHKRSGGGHEFSRPDYVRIRDMLEVEYLRDCVDFSTNEVSRAVSEATGWYENQLEAGFKIDAHNTVVVLLVTAAVLQNTYGSLNDETLEAFVTHGIVSEDVVQDLENSVDIDYGR